MRRCASTNWLVLLAMIACTAPAELQRRPEQAPQTSTLDPVDSSNGSELEHSAPMLCEAPHDRLERTFDVYSDGAEWDGQLASHNDENFDQGSGLAVADFTGDGHLDVFVADQEIPRLLAQTTGGWIDLTDTWLPAPGDLRRATGAAAVDLDADGDLDLYLSRYLDGDVLLINQGDHFQPLPIGPTGARGTGSSWADIDHDGDLDGFIATHGEPVVSSDANRVLRNDGVGGFVDIASDYPPELIDAFTLAGGWHDVDDDGWMDLYVVNDFGYREQPNQIGWGSAAGIAIDPRVKGLDIGVDGMGLAAADMNGDGLLDFLVSAWDDMAYLKSDGSKTWFDAAAAAGLESHVVLEYSNIAWGNAFADLDNDGDLDVLIANGNIDWPTDPRVGDLAFAQGPDGNFVNTTEAWGLESQGTSRGLLVADFDDNGWLDVLVADLHAPPRLRLARCGDDAWMRVLPRQRGPNPFAIGAVITAVSKDRSWTRTVHAGGTSMASGGPPEVHFGLGDLDWLDRLEIRWPDGAHDIFEHVPARTIATVTRARTHYD